MTARASGRRTIGSVLAELREEFPQISVSKIRFLEAEGLVTPHRSASGYRQYTPEDVARLRYVLRAQRDRFWPLKVIRDALDALDRGLDPGDGEAASGRPRPRAAEADPQVPTVGQLGTLPRGPRLTAAEIASASDAPLDLVEELAAYGLLRADREGHFGGESPRIAAAAAALCRFGIEARHLRPFRTAAQREVGLVEYAVSSGERPAALEVVGACLALHTALVKDQFAGRTD